MKNVKTNSIRVSDSVYKFVYKSAKYSVSDSVWKSVEDSVWDSYGIPRGSL